jgi:phosphoglycerate dehydrogenase-like enzyme
LTRTLPSETKLVICVWHAFTLWRPPASLAVNIRGRWPEMSVVHLPTYEGLSEEIRDADILVGFSLRPGQLRAAKKLKWIHATAAGVHQLMFPELRASGVLLTNARGVHAVPMAEHIVGMMLAMARKFPGALRHQLARHWGQQEIWDEPQRPRELAGQVALLVGFGAIGREVARRLRPMGVEVRAVTRSGRGDLSLAARIYPAGELCAALAQADCVIVAAPETPETRRLIGGRELAAMKPAATLINVARGTLVDEAALVEALASGRIAGAALDVAEREPLPPESPLWSAPNVFITPHISSVSDALWARQEELLLDNLERWFAGRELRNVVDWERGY